MFMSHQYYKPAKSRLQRSELAVPGSSPKMFEKALSSTADYIFLDLEDAVSPNDKISARANIIKALNEMNWRENGKTISVRINSLDTHYMYSDLVEIVETSSCITSGEICRYPTALYLKALGSLSHTETE